jgi:hypothetical protein
MPIRFSAVLLIITTAAPAGAMDICEVLSHLSALNGKTIRVEGVWVQSHSSGEYLLSQARCKEPTIRGGWQFWDAIQLVDQHGRSKGKFFNSRSENSKTIAIFSGRLETREYFRVRKSPLSEDLLDAFGYSAARLVFTGRPLEVVHLPWKEGETRDWQERWRNPYPRRVDSH